jgi:hypothetical protein
VGDLGLSFADYAGFTDAIGCRAEEKQREAREVFRKIYPKLALAERIAIAIAWRRFVDGGIVEWAEFNQIVNKVLDGRCSSQELQELSTSSQSALPF